MLKTPFIPVDKITHTLVEAANYVDMFAKAGNKTKILFALQSYY